MGNKNGKNVEDLEKSGIHIKDFHEGNQLIDYISKFLVSHNKFITVTEKNDISSKKIIFNFHTSILVTIFYR